MSIFRCYLCRSEFEDKDLAMPLNIELQLPFGMLHLTILTHYMCALNHFLKDLEAIEGLLDKDRTAIQGRLMETLTAIEKGSVH